VQSFEISANLIVWGDSCTTSDIFCFIHTYSHQKKKGKEKGFSANHGRLDEMDVLVWMCLTTDDCWEIFYPLYMSMEAITVRIALCKCRLHY